jgi:hypothetical protein
MSQDNSDINTRINKLMIKLSDRVFKHNRTKISSLKTTLKGFESKDRFVRKISLFKLTIQIRNLLKSGDMLT